METIRQIIPGSKGDQGNQGIQGAKGDTGLQGPKGDTGTTGAKGDTGTTGAKGDTGTTGAKGDTGDVGARGALWTVGTTAPSNAVGANGDLYLRNGTGEIYLKSGGTYSIVANIQGAPMGVSAASTQTSVNPSVTAVTVLASNASRKGLLIYNNSNTLTWYILFGTGASTTAFSVQLAPGDTYENTLSTQVLTGVSSGAAGGTLQVTEFT